MATSTESTVVYAAGVVQGVALVTFPAAGAILTDPAEYDLTSTQYGLLFVPQVVTAITAALLGASLSGRFGTKRVLIAGLAAGLAAMTLLLVSQFFIDDQALAYGLLLVATGALGVGFGLTVPTLNTLTAAFHAERPERSVLVLNALLGCGTVLAPVFVAIFVGLGFWWGLPLLAAIALIGLVVMSAGLPLRVEPVAGAARSANGIPARFWVFAGFAVLYGICETLNGNWAQLDMRDLGASATQASLALTAFWATVTIGRVLFAALERILPPPVVYHGLPFLLAGAFVLVALLPDDDPVLGILAFALAGLGCSALLPLTISFAQTELAGMAAAAAGGVIAFYQLGYGIAAFGVGPLDDAGVELSTVYAFAALVAAAMGAWSFAVVRRRGDALRAEPR
jgi:MFS family permease